jgi:hypothetical protein
VSRANDIVDVLLEGEDTTDLEAFVRGAGVVSPGRTVANAWEQARQRKAEGPIRYTDRVSARYFYASDVRWGNGHYDARSDVVKGATYVSVEAALPEYVCDAWATFRGKKMLVKKRVTTDVQFQNVEAAVDQLYEWLTREFQKWDDLAWIRRAFRRLPDETVVAVFSEMKKIFTGFDLYGLAYYEGYGEARSTISASKAAKIRAWLQARLPQLGITEGVEEIDMEKFLRDAQVAILPEDFKWDERMDRFGRWSTGNIRVAVYYKRLLYKGQPVYIGSVMGCHDYNTTGHSGIVHYYADPPKRTWSHIPVDKKGVPHPRKAQQRQNYGYGAVHMNTPQGSSSFSSLFDASRWLLRLLRVQHPLRQAP